MLTISNITLRMAGRVLIEDSSASLPPFAKIGLVGRNGTGKTTLFKAIVNELPLETGEISLPERARIGRVAQEAPSTDESLLEIVLKADEERTRLLHELEVNPINAADIHDRLEAINAGTAIARATQILKGLGFDEEAQARAAKEFSGGWRMRVALAAMLFSKPDFLMLDEPTNYLDLEGTTWLTDYLQKSQQTALIISHDKGLLDDVCDYILYLEGQKLTLWKGNYTSVMKLKNEQEMLQAKNIKKTEARRKELTAFVDRFKAKASKAAQAQSRMKMLEKMTIEAPIRHDDAPPIIIPNPVKKASPPILTLENASTGYDESNPILKRLNLRIDDDDRIGLLGANGQGKSTFLKLISERLPLFSGEKVTMSGLKIAYFAQHQLDELRPEENVLQHILRLVPDAPEAKRRGIAARFGFSGDRAETLVKSLSGGEKARLLLGLVTFEGVHLLILDEPTNHLDIGAREALVEALNTYEGAVIVVAHDKYLLESCVDRLWMTKDGTINPYNGTIDDYIAELLEKPVVVEFAKKEKSENMSKREKEALQFEKRIGGYRAQIEKIDSILSQEGYYQAHPANAATAIKAREKAEKEIAILEAKWFEMVGV